MSKGEVVLLDWWASPFCMRAKIALEEKGVKHERREEKLFGGKSELLLKSNPIHQKVPVLLHNGKPISESTIVVGYIDELWSSSTSLLPTCPYKRAQARFWADFIDKRNKEEGEKDLKKITVKRSKGEVVLLDCWASPFCMRAKIALDEKGVQHERREEKLFGGKSELLLKSNPIHQKVPVLLHNGKPISESTIVVGYIDELWSSSTSLLPTCPYKRAQARFWADFVDKRVFEAGREIWTSEGEAKEVAKKDFLEILKQLAEGALGDKSFYGGDAFGFVDIIAIGLTSWFVAYEKFGGFKAEDSCPKFSAWMKTCMQRETVAKVLPDSEKIYEFVITLRKMHGIQ